MAKSLTNHPGGRLQTRARILALAGLVALASGCSRPSTLDEVHSEGVVHVITRNAPSIFYQGRDGPTGFEYELAQRFADHLGVELRVRVADGNEEILSVLKRGYADIGLAGLARNGGHGSELRALPNGLEAESILIHNADIPRPESLGELAAAGIVIHAAADSNHIPHLNRLSREYPQLAFRAHPRLDAAGVLKRVEAGQFQAAVVDSNELALHHVYFPQVKHAFSISDPQPITWLFPPGQDDSLINAARAFLGQLKNNGTLAQLQERFYGHLDRLNYVGAKTFVRHVQERLPRYEPLFREHGTRFGIDWRLLAAIGYQESNWRPDAVSPTGVRGLMMLTLNTAQSVDVSNRLDPAHSIRGGARYFRRVHRRVPERIQEPDRTWFALAAYNVGFGHLEDARRLTQGAGGDPDRWLEVMEYLPLLTQKEWYSRTRYGYARGNEAVQYVQNIRRYYDVLVWMKDPADPENRLAQQSDIRVNIAPEVRTYARDTPGPAAREKPTELPRSMTMTPPTL